MTATALDAALGWLTVAAHCIDRAAACAAIGQVEADERYAQLRAQLDAEIREAAHDLQIARVIHARLEAERVAAGEVAA